MNGKKTDLLGVALLFVVALFLIAVFIFSSQTSREPCPRLV
jgi:hypothetical protein